MVLLVLGALVTAGVVVTSGLLAAPPVATARTTLTGTVTATGTAPALPWPAGPAAAGQQAAVTIPEVGYAAQSGTEQPRPIASLTKIMTGYLILKDHPLAPTPNPSVAGGLTGDNGPKVTIDATDVADFNNDAGLDQSNAEVRVGEVLTERQLLEGMLVHSANNMATTLARWDAGSVPAFVAKMNATAKTLGMDHTHYVDASGYDPQDQSTAADLLKVAALAMREPVFAQSVSLRAVTLPITGTVASYTPMLGMPGVVGVKSGVTTAAGGCDVIAVQKVIDGRPVLVLAASLGTTGYNVLGQAGHQAYALANAAATGVEQVPVISAGQPVAQLSAGGHTVTVVARTSLSVLAWPGSVIERKVSTRQTVTAGASSGTAAGTLLVTLGSQIETVSLATSKRLPPLTLVQRLF
jgi:D-alanyl-D-alanine carboxypeptidase (penicillin-binding protein 5/6)